MTCNERTLITQNSWKSADVEDALNMGKGNMSSLDPFFDIDPLLTPSTTPIQPQAVMDEDILTSMGFLSCNK